MTRRRHRFHRPELLSAKARVLSRPGRETAGVDGVVPVDRERQERSGRRPDLAHDLHRAINAGRYSFSPLRRTKVEHAHKAREINVPTYQDRVVLAAIWMRLGRTFRCEYRPHVVSRPGGPGSNRVLRGVIEGLRSGDFGALSSIDIRAAFPNLQVKDALSVLGDKGADHASLRLLQRFLEQAWRGQPGAPLGAAPSSLLLDAFLANYDRGIEQAGIRVHRYVDDYLLIASDWVELARARTFLQVNLPAPMEFNPPAHGPLGSTAYLGWSITPDGDWWPAAGRWTHLVRLLEEVGAPGEREQKLLGWIHQHALEPMSLEQLDQRVPAWCEVNDVAC